MKGKSLTILVSVFSALACSTERSDTSADTGVRTVTAYPAGQEPGAQDAPSGGPITLSAADLDGFEKGIARETQLVKEAKQRSMNAATAQERGDAIQATFETNTIPAAAGVTGLSPERYKLVRETVSTIMTTLDFQGKIDGPQSVDTARAGADMKARLASDPYAALDPASAAELKSRIDRIAPVWIEYINLTAVGG